MKRYGAIALGLYLAMPHLHTGTNNETHRRDGHELVVAAKEDVVYNPNSWEKMTSNDWDRIEKKSALLSIRV